MAVYKVPQDVEADDKLYTCYCHECTIGQGILWHPITYKKKKG